METYTPTVTQQLIWAGHQMDLSSPHSNMAFAFHINHTINIDVFLNAIETAINECDVMRSRYTDLGFLYFAENKANVSYYENIADPDLWLKTEVQRPFDLNGELYKTSVIKLEENHFIWFINQHHLLTDGWSVFILQKRVCDHYEKLMGKEVTMNVLPSFENYLKGETDKKDKEQKFWEKQKKLIPLKKGYFGKLDSKKRNKTSRVIIEISPKKYDLLLEQLRLPEYRSWSMDQSLYAVFMSISSLLVRRFCGTSTPVIGTPIHGRNSFEFRQTIGPFLKMFPLLTKIEKEDTYSSIYSRVKENIAGLLKNTISIDSSVELNNSFNTVFNYLNVNVHKTETISMQGEWLDSGYSDPGYTMKIQVFNFNGEKTPTITIDFSDEIFDEGHRNLVVRYFKQLIDCFTTEISDPIDKTHVADLRAIHSFNDTFKPYDKHATIISLFSEQVKENADHTAVSFEDKKLSYLELDQKSNQVAHFLADRGLVEGSHIGVYMERSLELMITLMGILKSGAAYVPIDTGFPLNRVEQIYSEGELSLVIGLNRQKDLVDEKFNIESVEDILTRSLQDSPINNSHALSLCYIIYTSGSTGKPKGVMNVTEGVVNRLLWARENYALESMKDTILQKTSISFDVSVWELFLPLISGVPLRFLRPNGQKDSKYICDIINSEKITTIHFVPSMLEVFLLSIEAGDCESLKRVLCSGEALKIEHVDAFVKKLPSCELHNLYGPTEAAIDVTAIEVIPKTSFVTSVPIGKPIANTEIRILREDKNYCSIGELGTIFIGGIQVAKGYYNNETLTNKSFVSIDGSTQKYYNTGDLGYWLPDGNIVYVGREDFQLKIRGNRVELGEIDHVVTTLPKVKQAATVFLDEAKTSYLVTFIVSDGFVEEEEILVEIESRLPEYMIPSRLVFIEELPVNSSGKLDRKKLKQLGKKEPVSEKAKEKPKSEIELVVQSIWSEVLGVEEIGLHESFFRLGGDSLNGIKIIIKINNEMGLELPVVVILQEHTIYKLSQYIEKTIMKLLADQ